jgi:hypothetical protein
MKILGFAVLLMLSFAFSSCRAQPGSRPTGEVWRTWNTPDGKVHTEFVRDMTPEEAAGPVTETITAGKKN